MANGSIQSGGVGLGGGENMEEVSPALRQQERDGTCVQVCKLRKVFNTPVGELVAVNELSVNMYQRLIFALLGHNGAVKTTTINMLTGLLPPTSGDAFILGQPVTSNMETIRQSLGVCPQHDVLYPELTVLEHLRLYARIKAIEKRVVEEKIMDKVREVGLTEKVHTRSSALSGGQKRKLSVAIALIADSGMVFLDEPTSGMDPYSRRSTWDLLRNNRDGRVSVLTTHFMDEADLLGDRIGIMAAGELRCCGSSLFLKNRFGAGYNLTIVKEESFKGSELHHLVTTTIPDTKMLSNVGAEISYQLPLSASPVFSQLFESLNGGLSELGIAQYGVSVTTMEEVFLRVAEVGDKDEQERQQSFSKDLSFRRRSLSQNGFREAAQAQAGPSPTPLASQLKEGLWCGGTSELYSCSSSQQVN